MISTPIPLLSNLPYPAVPIHSTEESEEEEKKRISRRKNNLLSIEQSNQLNGICPEWSKNISYVLFQEIEIQTRVKSLALLISSYYRREGICGTNRKILCVGLLTGAIVFLSDLLRHFTIPYEVDFVTLSSYGKGTVSSGSVKLKKDLSIDPAGRDILIIEDLIDTGNTLAWLRNHLLHKNCSRVAICCLLDKKARRTANVAIEFTGFNCPDEFVIGYGMDFADEYRCLPWVGVLREEAYK